MTDRHLTVLEARRDLGNLVLDALAGKTTVITRYGKPAAVLQPVSAHPYSPGARIIELPTGGTVALSLDDINVFGRERGDHEFVFDVIDRVRKFAAELADLVEAYGAAKPEPAESVTQ